MISWLLQPLVQIADKNGNPVVGAKVYVYYSTPETLATIYSDDSGTVQENPVLTDTLGNVTVFADTEYLYDVIVYDPNGNLLFGKKHIAPASLLDVSSNEVKVEAGEGINVSKTVSEGQITYTVSCDFDMFTLEETVAQKQDRLEAGQNIEITNQNIINVTGRKSFDVHRPLVKEITDTRVVIGVDGNELKDYIITGGLLSDDYVPWSATNLPIGNQNQATNIAGAFGIENSAIENSYAFGRNTTASGTSFAQGDTNSATNCSVVFGYNNSGDRTSFIQGFDNSASLQSQIFGFRNYANTNSTVLGYDNSAVVSRIIGYSNSGNYTKIIGDNCSATNALFVAGNANTATVYQSFAIGAGLSVNTTKAAMGRYNIDRPDTEFCYGIGTDDNYRLNAFEVKNDGTFVTNDLESLSVSVGGTLNYSPTIVDYRNGGVLIGSSSQTRNLSISLLDVRKGGTVCMNLYIPNIHMNYMETVQSNSYIQMTIEDEDDNIIWLNRIKLTDLNQVIQMNFMYQNNTNAIKHLYLRLSSDLYFQENVNDRLVYMNGGYIFG